MSIKNILSRLLEKKGIKNVDELSPEEKIDFQRWDKILSEGEMTVDKVALFCENERKRIEILWRDLNNSEKKNERLILLHTVYGILIQAISSPQTEKESLERYLQSLVEEK